MIGVAHRAAQHVGDGDHAAQRLEGAEAEALALVLDPDLADAQSRRQGRQLIERRRLVGRAGLELLAQFGNPVGIDHELLLAAEVEGALGARDSWPARGSSWQGHSMLSSAKRSDP